MSGDTLGRVHNGKTGSPNTGRQFHAENFKQLNFRRGHFPYVGLSR